MIEVAIRINQLLTSNVNSMIDSATSPEKILQLLITDLEEAIIALSRDAGRDGRAARDGASSAGRHDVASAGWAEKARFAMDKKREDLARGALIERDKAADAAARQREAATLAEANAASARETITALEIKLAEARAKLTSLRQSGAAQSREAYVGAPSRSKARSDAVLDRVDTIEKRFEFAQATRGESKAQSLDEELAQMARDARLETELAEMRKGGKKAR